MRDAELALDSDLADAMSALEIAERDLAVAEQNAMAISDNDLTTAQNTYDERLQDYANVIYKWTGITATNADLDMAPKDFFASIAFDPEQVFTRDYDYLFPNARLEDNPDTRWNELKNIRLDGAIPYQQPDSDALRPLHIRRNSPVRHCQHKWRFLRRARYAQRA